MDIPHDEMTAVEELERVCRTHRVELRFTEEQGAGLFEQGLGVRLFYDDHDLEWGTTLFWTKGNPCPPTKETVALATLRLLAMEQMGTILKSHRPEEKWTGIGWIADAEATGA